MHDSTIGSEFRALILTFYKPIRTNATNQLVVATLQDGRVRLIDIDDGPMDDSLMWTLYEYNPSIKEIIDAHASPILKNRLSTLQLLRM